MLDSWFYYYLSASCAFAFGFLVILEDFGRKRAFDLCISLQISSFSGNFIVIAIAVISAVYCFNLGPGFSSDAVRLGRYVSFAIISSIFSRVSDLCQIRLCLDFSLSSSSFFFAL